MSWPAQVQDALPRDATCYSEDTGTREQLAEWVENRRILTCCETGREHLVLTVFLEAAGRTTCYAAYVDLGRPYLIPMASVTLRAKAVRKWTRGPNGVPVEVA